MHKKIFLLFLPFAFLGCPTSPDCEPNCTADPDQEPQEQVPSYDDTCWGQLYANSTPISSWSNQGCLDEIVLDTDIPLIGEAGEMQVHLDADFDGEQLYLVYNTANTETEDMGIRGRTLKCNGTLGTEVQINDEQRLFTDPQIAVNSDEIMVLWQRDIPELGPHNLDVLVQALSKEYTPLTTENHVLEMERNGVPEIKNAWMTAVTPARQGLYWSFGARGHDEATTFQIFGQALDSQGVPLCDSLDLNFAPEIGQVYPVADAKGAHVLVAWESNEEQGTEIQYIYANGGSLHLATQESTTVQGDAQRPAVALSPDGTKSALAFFTQSGSSNKVFLLHPQHSENIIQVGNPAKSAHSPAVALGDNGGMVFWLENLSGIKNNAYYQAFHWQEDRYVLVGIATQIESDKVLPYAPLMLHLGAEHYFMGWMAGDHPNYQAFGRFVVASEL